MCNETIGKFIICFLVFIQIEVTDITGYDLQDQTSPRTNTLFDDADDIQRQLDNEVRDRIKYGRPKTIWVFHFPQHASCKNLVNHYSKGRKIPRRADKYCTTEYTFVDIKAQNQDLDYIGWDYMSQNRWHQIYPDCAGRSQSPVDLPFSGLKKTKGARPIVFNYYDVMPTSMTVTNDGQRLTLSGVWPLYKRPMIHGGAAYSRRYLFHSLSLHWPSEHVISGLTYPLETQALFISAEYKSLPEAVQGSRKDSLSMLSISSIYKTKSISKDFVYTYNGLLPDFGYGGQSHQRLANYAVDIIVHKYMSRHKCTSLLPPIVRWDGYPTQSERDWAQNRQFNVLSEALRSVTIFKYGHTTHAGLKDLMNTTLSYSYQKRIRPKPLGFFTPTFKKYVAYQGSLSVPPCTEAVLWLIRAHSLYVEREFLEAMEKKSAPDVMPKKTFRRNPQPLNDRKCFMFT